MSHRYQSDVRLDTADARRPQLVVTIPLDQAVGRSPSHGCWYNTTSRVLPGSRLPIEVLVRR